MYQKYHTDALVLGSREYGEADKVCVLFTQEFGLVRARASAVRAEKSRMRFALQDFTHATVSLVRGARGWRVAGAAVKTHAPKELPSLAVFARVSRLVTRLVHGEEKNEYLYDVLAGAHESLQAAPNDMLSSVELVCVARVLYALGYLSTPALGSALFTHTAYAHAHLREADDVRDHLLTSINQAISETQL